MQSSSNTGLLPLAFSVVTFITAMMVLIAPLPIAAQTSSQASENTQANQTEQPSSDSPFFRTAIPENVPATFTCHQAGAEIIKLDNISSFLPSKVEGIFTYSLITKDGRNHLVYLGSTTTCSLTVTPPP